MLQWNPVNTATIGPKKIGHINDGFSTRKCMAIFARQPPKSGFNNEVAVLQRGGRKAGGSTVTINSRTKLAHCRLVLWAVSIFLCAFRSCSKWILALILLQLELTVAKGLWERRFIWRISLKNYLAVSKFFAHLLKKTKIFTLKPTRAPHCGTQRLRIFFAL